MGRFAHKVVAAISFAAVASTIVVAPVLAECFPRPPAGTPIVRPYVFSATVRDVVTEVDQQSVDAGEGPGVRWRTTLDVGRVYRGSVANVLMLNGSTLDTGFSGNCTYFLGDRLTPGETLFIALDEQIPFNTNSGLFGNMLLWRARGGWEFYADALQEGADLDAYPREAREAHTTSQVLAVIAAAVPDTATAPASASAGPAEDDWMQTFAMIGLGLVAGLLAFIRAGPRRMPVRVVATVVAISASALIIGMALT